jgi:glycosyltransferase involved in cell wall biosynthesis
MNKENPKVSVIICAYTMERLKDIHEAVNSVLSQSLKPYEVIISVDHNEELFQRLKAEFPSRVSVILNKGAQGLSETRNIGIRGSTGDIVAFIDDDAIAGKDWLENLTKHFHDPRVVAVGGRAVPTWPNGRRPPWFPKELDWIVGCTYEGLPLEGNEVRNVPGCNMMFERETFSKAGFWENKIGSIGQSLKGGEEAELCIRIKSKMPDCLILWEPGAVIHHKISLCRTSLRWILKVSFDQGFCKAKVKKFCESVSQEPLLTENLYLRYLLFKSIPDKLKGFWRESSLLQIGAIILSIAATGTGYLVGKLKRAT